MPRKPVTVSLPEEMVSAAGQFCKRRACTLSEVVRNAMKDYLFREEMEEARHAFTLRVQQEGIFSERDLIDRLES